MSLRDKATRTVCFDSRDRYWACLDADPKVREECYQLRQSYEAVCPSQWVKHFDRKRQYMELKEKINSIRFAEPPSSPSCPPLGEIMLRRHQRVYRGIASS